VEKCFSNQINTKSNKKWEENQEIPAPSHSGPNPQLVACLAWICQTPDNAFMLSLRSSLSLLILRFTMNLGHLLRRSVLPSLRSATFIRGGPPKAKKAEVSDEPKRKQAKVTSGAAKKKKSDEEGPGASRHDMILEALKPRIIKKVAEPPEELQRRCTRCLV
jgi:hypothetical protein